MDDDDLFTPESMAQFRRRTAQAAGLGQQLLQQYREDREAQIAEAPDLQAWIDALEDGDLAAATDPGLWSRMAALGFIEVPTPRTPHADHGVFVVRIISPKVFDAFRTGDGPRSDYAFTTVNVCLRRDAVPGGLAVPLRWSNPALIDTELFELPPDVTDDAFVDLEKIHIIYLAATENGRFVCKPVYIGIGTGEAYGTGPRQRTTRGRFRLYRYDVKDNFQLEYIRLTLGHDQERENVRALPRIPPLGETRSTLVLAKSAADSSFMSLSDPEVARWHTVWLKDHPENRIVYREITLEKVHDDLRTGRPDRPRRLQPTTLWPCLPTPGTFSVGTTSRGSTQGASARRRGLISTTTCSQRSAERSTKSGAFSRRSSACQRTTPPQPISPSRASCARRSFASNSKPTGPARSPGWISGCSRR
jgi:hypothetical protein